MNSINRKKSMTQNPVSFEIILTLLFFLALFPFLSQAQNTAQASMTNGDAACIDQSLINPNTPCTTIYQPVCGCNGVTYPNECVAQNQHGVTEWTDGPCNNCNLEIDITAFDYTCLGADVCVGIFNGQAPFTISLYNTSAGTTTTNDNLEVCFSDLEPGTYEVVVVDATGCSAVVIFSIPVIDYNVEAQVTDVTCFGGHDGAIDLWLPAGLPVWIEWTGPNGFTAETEDIDNLIAGLYTVVVHVNDGSCYTTGSFLVGQPDELSAEFIQTGSQCDGQIDGCLLIDGGTEPYYLWIFTSTDLNVDVSALEPVIDANGNAHVDGMIQTDDIQLDAGGIYQNEICAQDIPVGTYYVLVADANWCWTFEVIEIEAEEGLTATFEITSDVCADQVDGCLYVDGGTAPYDVYVWQLPGTDPANTDVSITPNGPTIDGVAPNSDVAFENDGTTADYQRCAHDIPAGTYVVLVVDANGCYTLLTVEIPEANPLNAEFIITSEACNDEVDGCLIIHGGSQPYFINVFTCPDPSIVTDVNATFNSDGTVSVEGMITSDVQIQAPEPNGLFGNEVCVEDIPAGTYYVIIADANGCWTYIVVEIPEANGLTIVGEMIDVSCFGGNDGAIELSINGGVPPYTAYWVNENGETGENFNHLFAGTYEVFVFDTNQCTATATFTIHQPAELKAEFEITSDVCADQVDGCLYIHGGTEPYQVFVWNLPSPYPANNDVTITPNGPTIDGVAPNSDVAFEADGIAGNFVRCAQDIPAGAYLILVLDANGCYELLFVEIPEANPLHADFIITSEICDEEVDGCLIINGGTQPYNINVFTCPDPSVITDVNATFNSDGTVSVEGMIASDVQIQAPEPNGYYGNEICVENIPAGTYYVIIDDANGCWTYIVVEIPEVEGLSIEGEVKHVSCHGGNDGAIELHISGGTPPYHAQWVNEAGETGDNFNHLSAGTYEVFVYDAHQCTATAVFTIHQPTQLKAEFEITSEACDAEVDGCLYIHGGTPAYRVWVFTCPNPLPTLPEPDFSTDVPSVDGMVLNSDVYFPAVSSAGDVICAENIAPATYYVLIADENNCWIFETIVVEPAAGIALEGELTHASCAGNDGTIDITVFGNYPPYFFKWSNGATTEDIEGLEPGTYTVQVYNETDFCTATATFIVEGFGSLATNLTFDPYGSHACVDPVGGTEPYMIEWIDLNTGEPLNNADVYCVQGLAPGAYLVNVIDANGCEASDIFFIEEPICSGGEAKVDPAEIESGENTNFLLYNYTGVSIQWQFKTENTAWLSIPGATSAQYVTPAINAAVDKEIRVRAAVSCTNGDVVYSTEALLIVFGDPTLDVQQVAADRNLFDSETPNAEFTTELSAAFPTITEAYVNVQFKATLENITTVSIMDLNGKLYENKDFVQVNAGQVERFDFSSFSSGMYLIRVQNDRHVVTHKVFVEKQ